MGRPSGISRAGCPGDVDGVFPGVRLRSGQTPSAEAVSTYPGVPGALATYRRVPLAGPPPTSRSKQRRGRGGRPSKVPAPFPATPIIPGGVQHTDGLRGSSRAHPWASRGPRGMGVAAALAPAGGFGTRRALRRGHRSRGKREREGSYGMWFFPWWSKERRKGLGSPEPSGEQRRPRWRGRGKESQRER